MQADHPHVVAYFPVLLDCQLVAHRLNAGFHCYVALGNVVRLIEWERPIPVDVETDALVALQEYQKITGI